VYDLWADDPAPDRFLAAADDKRLHGQRGLRERFAGGIRASRPYFPEMERIFREEDLPVELVRLPLIESCFDLRAYSKAGAAGVAARNFYGECLAALEVERDVKTYFGDLSDEPPLRLRERRLERPLGIEAAARLTRTGRSQLASLNPALSTLVVSGRRPIPSGYRLRLPESAGSSFENRLAEFSAARRVTTSLTARPRPVAAAAERGDPPA